MHHPQRPVPHNGRPSHSGLSQRTTGSQDPPVLPYTRLYTRYAALHPLSKAYLTPSCRLSLLSSLLTLSWFLTAHILEYTSINTCRLSSPHLWWLIFGILCTMYFMILEVFILGFIVFIIAPILFVRDPSSLSALVRRSPQHADSSRPRSYFGIFSSSASAGILSRILQSSSPRLASSPRSSWIRYPWSCTSPLLLMRR